MFTKSNALLPEINIGLQILDWREEFDFECLVLSYGNCPPSLTLRRVNFAAPPKAGKARNDPPSPRASDFACATPDEPEGGPP